MATKNIRIGDKEFKVEDVTDKKKELQDKISGIEETLAHVRKHSNDIHETCKTNNSIDATLKSTIESLQKEQDSSKKLLDDSAAFGKKETERANELEKKSKEAEARADACEKEKKLTTTNSFNLIFKASEKTIADAERTIKNGKKLIVNELPLDDNIKEIYPSIESKDVEKTLTLENTLDNLKIFAEVNRIRTLKKIYPKIQEYLESWRSTFAEKEACEKKSKAAEDVKVAEAKAAEDVKAAEAKAAKAVEEAKAAAEANVASTAKVEETKKGGNRRSKEYIKYKKEYLTLKKHLKNK
jgi:hypothetical protein